MMKRTLWIYFTLAASLGAWVGQARVGTFEVIFCTAFGFSLYAGVLLMGVALMMASGPWRRE